VQNPSPTSRRGAFVEIALIFAVFFLQGAWPVPDVNEPYYLGKAIHYWNPDWLRGDFFMESSDSHQVFYMTFGWLSLCLSQEHLAWTGRILTWLLLAWTWRRLSVAVIPRPWCSVLTAALFAGLMEHCHMAGEWVIGGIEAKGFAYALVFLGLESLVRDRWNRALWLFGAAASFHVLVGGWSAVAAGIAWLCSTAAPGRASGCPEITANGDRAASKGRPPLRTLWPGIAGGILLALPGLIPVWGLDWGVDRETARQAHQIYVFGRLPHHLTLSGMRGELIARMILLWIFWLALGRSWPKNESVRRLRAFVAGAATIAWIGAAVNLLMLWDRALAAELLRYYWFRLADAALPLGTALEIVGLIVWALRDRPAWGRIGLAAAVTAAACHLGWVADQRGWDRFEPLPPRSYGSIGRVGMPPRTRAEKLADFKNWRDACRWAADPSNIPPGARFLTPRLGQTFKWYSQHPSVADWKDVPQDSKAMVEWWRRLGDIYNIPTEWRKTLSELGTGRLKELGRRYDAEYAIAERTEPPLDLDIVYENEAYIIYRLQ